MKQYRGVRVNPGFKAEVYVNDQPLDLTPSKISVHDYDADAPEWGYYGSGPSQTAAAILLDMTGDAELSKMYHQDFKRDFIACYEQEVGFVLLEIEIRLWLDKRAKFEKGDIL